MPRPIVIVAETPSALWFFPAPEGITTPTETRLWVQSRLREIWRPDLATPSRAVEIEADILSVKVAGSDAIRVIKTGQYRPSDLGFF